MMDELEIRAVIRGLQCLGGDGHQPRCSDCPYHGRGKPPCRIAICADAQRLIRASVDDQKDEHFYSKDDVGS